MPSEQICPPVTEPISQDHSQSQIKHCISCRRPLIIESANPAFFDHNDSANVCTPCREQMSLGRLSLSETYGLYDQVNTQVVLRVAYIDQAHDSASSTHHGTFIDEPSSLNNDMDIDADLQSLESPYIPTTYQHIPISPQNLRTHLRIVCDTDKPSNVVSSPSSFHTRPSGSSSRTQSYSPAASCPDPLVDITRIRIRSRGHHCLYPGASFQGTQKSGRNSYDVNVTIVDVDFASSFLCGYLRIRGLTDDWPELTTYFDAEIIGSRYGFLTQNWGATEQEDMVHWQRFNAFKHVKNDLKKPHLTMPDRDRGAVFMRWKERFLVPDHRVQDINGASFAGFYYVCVDFNPQPSGSIVRGAIPSTPETEDSALPPISLPSKTENAQLSRDPSAKYNGGRAPSAGPRSANPVPTMSGFYFHQNSEPYQQLNLEHVPETISSSFEFR